MYISSCYYDSPSSYQVTIGGMTSTSGHYQCFVEEYNSTEKNGRLYCLFSSGYVGTYTGTRNTSSNHCRTVYWVETSSGIATSQGNTYTKDYVFSLVAGGEDAFNKDYILRYGTPDSFSWATSPSQGSMITDTLKASEWNRFRSHIAALYSAYGGSYTYTKVSSGDLITASTYNNAVNAIHNLACDYWWNVSTVSSGDLIKASMFSGIVSDYNNAVSTFAYS